jgi:hypothetical protein
VLHRLLLIPLLSPLLAVLLVASINPKPWVSVRVLTWSSPSWPLGGWIAVAAGLGAAISSGGAALALQGLEPERPSRRQVRRRASANDDAQDSFERDEPDTGNQRSSWEPEPAASWAGPSRGAADPAPTVSVPFRVIRKGSAKTEPAPQQNPGAQASPAQADDWNTMLSDDW